VTFPADYRDARVHFVHAARRAGWLHRAWPVADAGDDLTVDVAIRPAAAGSGGRCLLVTSGLHGVEGFLGSAVQLELLERAAWPDDVRVVLVHSLNPWGFANLRRVDSRNVDLNRSFFAANQHPGHEAAPRLLRAALREGLAGIKQALAGGQYARPRGLFYGGHAPSGLQALLAEHLPSWVGDASEIRHVDVHTGLGPFAAASLLTYHAAGTADFARLAGRFGRGVQSLDPRAGVAYAIRGLFGSWCHDALAGRRYEFLAVECGTYSAPVVLAALAVENALHHSRWRGGGAHRMARAALREVFAPRSVGWRERTLRASLDVCARVLEP
jgi:hypothetical protein